MSRSSWLVILGGLAAGLSGCGRQDVGAPAPDPRPASWFSDVTSEAGLAFVHEPGGAGAFHMPEIMGAGGAFLDYDRDGDLDIYLINGNDALPEAAADPEASPNRLLRREDGGRYRDVTEASGLGDTGYGMGIAVGDIDNDGDPDVYLANYGPDRLYRNEGDGTFTDITAAAGIAVDGWSASAAFFDFDRDGFLDLFVCRYLDYSRPRRCADHAGRPDYCGPRTYPPVPDVLLRNNGDPGAPGFRDVSVQAGIAAVAAAGLGVICDDLDADGWIDVYVANDGYANHLWINERDGTFADRALVLGAAVNLAGATEAGMGVAAADVDGDADLDLFVTHQAQETNTLYVSQGEGEAFSFLDRTAASRLAASSFPLTGFGVAAFDVELDGDLDMVAVGGGVHRTEPQSGAVPPEPFDRYAEPNLFYLNASLDAGPPGREARFEPRADIGGPLCSTVEVSRGLATGDIDGDGDLDVLVTNVAGPARLYRNDAPRRGHWLMVEASDPALGRPALGARITVVVDGRRVVRTVSPAGSYLSSSDTRVHFGLGARDRFEAVDVRWPDGLRERFPGGDADRVMTLLRGSGERLP
jgi:hypothetical protein